ncbi:UDP-3-O-(3-hydroxymyristoyl)glucosamine N-acyltransferase [Acidicapsa acidisoli]|uniref:UDP-3-O-(3-hydroxymyristoyl)glucosamine N-acyltransferase n=1 Tax=Acidicapsa acidisoli TaxID=1615681 RepID=UPI0021E0AAA6|nr:UDP-3-O-(3-hydroxymyristoyl)glucosamine N-acyltransferase [Acidicapsa acidisoli]
MTVGELIDRLGGDLVQGDRETLLAGVADVEQAKELDLVFGENEAAVTRALSGWASAVVVPADYRPDETGRAAVIATAQPRLWFAKAARLLAEPLPAMGWHPAATISPDAHVAETVSIGAGAVVGHGAVIGEFSRVEAGAVIGNGVRIGEHCRIYPRVVLYPGTQVGDRVVIHAGAVLGADGFGYVRDRETGAYTQFPQQGTLVIEDDVEIGANSTIDRGALAETRIRRGVKLDNLVHIGHNCDIGEDVVIASQTGISGSSSVGKGAILAGQVGIGDHAHVGDGVILGGQAGVLSGKTLTTRGTVLWGTPAKPLREYLRELATLTRLARRKKD